MPRIVARNDSGEFLVAVGWAGIVIGEPDRLPDGSYHLGEEFMRVSHIQSITKGGYWNWVDEPVPEGLLNGNHIAQMLEFEVDSYKGMGGYMQREYLKYRPATGDPFLGGPPGER